MPTEGLTPHPPTAPSAEDLEKAREIPPTAADYLVAANVVARFNQDASPSTLSVRRRVLLGDLVAEAIRDARAQERRHCALEFEVVYAACRDSGLSVIYATCQALTAIRGGDRG